VAPVFTGLEYAAFRVLGVGTWQARTVPAASGVVAMAFLMAGLAALWGSRDSVMGRRVALIGGALLGWNFWWVMWNRAALMESTMTAFIVVAWAAYAMGERKPTWGFVAGLAASLAWFTKAAAAFFVAALVIDAGWVLATHWLPRLRQRAELTAPDERIVKTAWMSLAGLGFGFAAIGLFFVLPYWTDYQFYNWQMSVTRKPSYDLRSLIDRVTWLPVVHDMFTRMWIELVAAAVAILGIAARWRESKPAERLLAVWILLGLLELSVHDAGNERRYVMFLPALIALAAGLGGSGIVWLPAHFARSGWKQRLFAAPLIAFLGYLVAGSLLRSVFHTQVAASDYKLTVRLSAAIALALTLATMAFWPYVTGWFARQRVPPIAAVSAVTLLMMWNLGQYVGWASIHRELNYQASVALGQTLAPGTLVHGKLANGMSLENRIRPIFVGNGFGNYEDRLSRDDARYILTIGLPRVGRESQPGLMQDILDHYPKRRVLKTFDVDETPEFDQAWLIDKQPAPPSPAPAPGSSRAPD
jgi:4-amino-4-deoxy-L-arabinose transferase-like glycosyltransferase